MENTDQTFCFDNSTLFDILSQTLRLASGTFDDINYLLGQVMTGLSACFRFPGNGETTNFDEVRGEIRFRTIEYGPAKISREHDSISICSLSHHLIFTADNATLLALSQTHRTNVSQSNVRSAVSNVTVEPSEGKIFDRDGRVSRSIAFDSTSARAAQQRKTKTSLRPLDC